MTSQTQNEKTLTRKNLMSINDFCEFSLIDSQVISDLNIDEVSVPGSGLARMQFRTKWNFKTVFTITSFFKNINNSFFNCGVKT